MSAPETARDVIADTLAEDEGRPTVHRHYNGAEAVLDALTAAGFAVVKLPEAVHVCDRDAAWITPDGEVYQVDFDCRNGIWVSDRTTTTGQTFGPVWIPRAREVAEALLAAVVHAEAVSDE